MFPASPKVHPLTHDEFLRELSARQKARVQASVRVDSRVRPGERTHRRQD